MRRTPPSNIYRCEPCSIVVASERGTVTLRVTGEVDQEAWPAVEQALLSCLAVDCDEVVLDLVAVSFVSLSSCRHLHRAICSLVAAGRHVVVQPSRSLRRTVGLTISAAALPVSAASLLGG